MARYYRDLREYLAALEEAGKLRRTWEKLAQQGQPV